MKKIVTFFGVAVAVCMAALCFCPKTVAEAEASQPFTLIFECEDLLDTVPASAKASVVESEDASGGEYLLIKGTNTGAKGTADVGTVDAYTPKAGSYEIRVSHTFAETKNVYIWVRSRYNNTKTYGIYYSVNSIAYARKNINGANGFSWTLLQPQAVAARETLTVDLYHRNMSSYFDKIIITDDSTFNPTDKDDLPEGKQEEYGEFHITPKEGHPRIYITDDTLPAFQEKVKDSRYTSYVNSLIKNGASVDAASYDRSGVVNGSLNSLSISLRSRSLLYLAGIKDETYGRETIDRAMTYARTLVYNTDSSGVARSLGNSIWALAIVYDWHYDLLTDAEKEFFIGRMKYLCSYLECGYPIDHRVTFGHGCEYMIYRDMMAAGAAVFDEDKAIWADADAWFAKSAAYRREITPSGNYPEGTFYGDIRTASEYYAMFLLKPWGIPDAELFGEKFDEKMLKYLYLRMTDGELLFDGELNYRVDMEYYYRTWDSAMFNALLYPESDYYESMLGEALRGQVAWPENYDFWVLLFGDIAAVDNTKAEFDTLPLSWMGSYPFTHVIARTGWAIGIDAPTVISFVKGREIAAEFHMKPDNGSFQIYYKGILAANSQGDNDGFLVNAQDRNYSRRTISANCVTITDPNEIFFYNYYSGNDWMVLQNDGGQSLDFFRTTGRQETVEELIEDTGLLAQTQGKYNGPNTQTPIFTYLKSDLTSSYAGTLVHKQSGKTLKEVLADNGYTELIPEGATEGTMIDKTLMNSIYFTDFELERKVDSYKRATVFINTNNKDYPGAFICYDYVDAREASFEKKWLIHGLDDMMVEGNVITIVKDDAFYNGKLVNVTMLPGNADIELIGGEGKEGCFNGVNYYTKRSYDYYLYKSRWRAEVSPSNEQDTDIFLNAMYVTDADGNLPQLPMYQETTDVFVGATVLDNLVMFSKNALPVENGFTLTVRDNSDGQTMHCLITDVAAGVWTVIGGGRTQNVAVHAEENSLYFEGLPGEYTITPAAAGTAADSVAYPKLEGSRISRH